MTRQSDPALVHVSVYQRVFAAVPAGDEEALGELLHPKLVDHNPIPAQRPGSEGFKQWMRAARSSFPDLVAVVKDTVAEKDRVAGRVHYHGTHGGDFLGVGPTGRVVDFEAFHIVRFEEGMIVEWWGTADLLGALRQTGGRILGPEE
jgi:predicted ester cyclase